MGINFIDFWSIFHFIGGLFGRISIFPNNRVLSFMININLHLFIELIEKSKHWDGTVETPLNHFGDMIFFILGMFVGDIINPKIKFIEIRIIILYIYIFVSLKEILRELIYGLEN